MPRATLDNISKTNLDYFLNALQLSLNTKIHDVYLEKSNELHFEFNNDPSSDRSFQYFKKLMDAMWNTKKETVIIKNWDQKFSHSLINFLMLSRLKKENMQALAQLDPQYKVFVEKILGKSKTTNQSQATLVKNIKEASQMAFSQVEKYNMTLRELSQRSGLTQTALGKFKSGKDVRLSSLLKILKALNLKLQITE